MSIVVNRVCLLKIINRQAKSVNPDEMAHHEPSHMDLHCLHRYLYQSTGLKALKNNFTKYVSSCYISLLDTGLNFYTVHE